MLQNARLETFTVSELLRENQQGGGEGHYGYFPCHFANFVEFLGNLWAFFNVIFLKL